VTRSPAGKQHHAATVGGPDRHLTEPHSSQRELEQLMHSQLETLAREHLADLRRTAERGHLARRATLGAEPAIAMRSAQPQWRRLLLRVRAMRHPTQLVASQPTASDRS
jgi:hypothetical protein